MKQKTGRKPVDIVGRKYGWLVPLTRELNHMTNLSYWWCICTGDHAGQAGRERVVRVPYSALSQGRQRSCGCRRAQRGSLKDRVIWTDAEPADYETYGKEVPEVVMQRIREQAEAQGVRQYTEAELAELDDGVPWIGEKPSFPTE